jgi:hypothetical protein
MALVPLTGATFSWRTEGMTIFRWTWRRRPGLQGNADGSLRFSARPSLPVAARHSETPTYRSLGSLTCVPRTFRNTFRKC